MHAAPLQLLRTSDCPPHQVSSAPRRASEAANAGSSVWFAVVPRAQPSHVASLVHQFHIWATSEARRKELGLGSSLAAKVASDFHAQWRPEYSYAKATLMTSDCPPHHSDDV